jgi:hypothetical protein
VPAPNRVARQRPGCPPQILCAIGAAGAYAGHLDADEGGAPFDVALPPIFGFGIGVFAKELLKRGDIRLVHIGSLKLAGSNKGDVGGRARHAPRVVG